MKNKKLVAFASIIVLVLILNTVFGWSDNIRNVDNLKFLEDAVRENFPLAVILYMILTIVSCVLLALPGVTFAVLAGLLFGPLLGTILCSLASTAGAMLAFLAGRFFLKDSVKPMIQKNNYLKKWLFDTSRKNEIFVLMVTRLVPLFPYNLQNFAYGVTDISFVSYSIYSFLFMLPGTAMYTVGAAGITSTENRVLYIGIALLLAVSVFGIAYFFKKKYVQSDSEENESEEE